MASPARPDRRIVRQTNFGVNPAAEAFLKIAAGQGRASAGNQGDGRGADFPPGGILKARRP
jgi:hypothetical protein